MNKARGFRKKTTVGLAGGGAYMYMYMNTFYICKMSVFIVIRAHFAVIVTEMKSNPGNLS